MPKAYCNLNFPYEIGSWDEGIPLGNGFMGALIWGPMEALRFSLDRTDIWDAAPCPETESPEFTFKKLKELAQAGDAQEARRIFSDPYFKPLPSKLPGGKIVLDLGKRKSMACSLDISCAQAVIRADGCEVKSFLHAEEKVGMIRVETDGPLTVSLKNPEYGRPGEESGEPPEAGSLKQLVYPKARREDGPWEKYFLQEINPAFCYGVFVKIRPRDGGYEIAWLTAASADGPDWEKTAGRLLEDALERGYEAMFESHRSWWEGFWQKSGVSLPDREAEKYWYLTNYLFASCSRKGCYPMPLQGVWTADDGCLPPWKGDYHMDLNLQMSYYHYLKANHMPEGESYPDFLWDRRDAGRKFAEEFFGVKKGICLPPVMTIDGKALGGWPMYCLSPTNQLWLCQGFERHWRFSGDRQFLLERAYPYCRESAEFILEILEERDGFYYLPLSSSPEIHDDEKEAFVTPNSNYDLSLLRYLFSALIEMAKELGLKEEERWRKALEKLPQLAVNDKKVLMISPDESLEESHRHLSHLMAIHPLRLIDVHDPEGRKILDACILDLQRLGTGNWVGFSFTWMAELYALQGNGNAADYQLKTFWRHLCSPNGFHLNGDYKTLGITCMHYRPFTLEANMCAADALQEMLLQTEKGALDFFPAIPDGWKKETVSFRDFRGEGGILASAVMEAGTVREIRIRTGADEIVPVRKRESLLAMAEKNGWESRGDFYRLKAGEDGMIIATA